MVCGARAGLLTELSFGACILSGMTPVVSTFMAVAAAAAPFSAPTTIDNPYLPLYEVEAL